MSVSIPAILRQPIRLRWLGGVSAALLCSAAFAQLALSQRAPLPARLSATEFRSLIATASEPEGFFNSDNLLSNELTYQYVIPRLQQIVKPGGVYLGVGPEQNFTYIVAVRPRLAVIFDIRRGNLLLQLLYKALFEMSADRADFVSRMYSRHRPPGVDSTSGVAAIYDALATERGDSAAYRKNLAAIRDHLLKDDSLELSAADMTGIQYVYEAFFRAGPDLDYNYPTVRASQYGGRGMRPTYQTLMVADDGQGVQRGYLASEANYRLLRQMQLENLIVPIVADFAGPKGIATIGDYLRAHGATVTSIYTSNVEQYLFQSPTDWRNYYANVATLPLDSTSTFIRAVFASGRVISGLTGNQSVTLLSPVHSLLDEFHTGRLMSYADVVAMSK